MARAMASMRMRCIGRDLLGHGFETFRYRPFERVLEPLDGARSGGGNTLYVRDAGRLAERVRSAPRFRLGTGMEMWVWGWGVGVSAGRKSPSPVLVPAPCGGKTEPEGLR